jgi:hypothetical protein
MNGVGNVIAINDDDSISITTQGSQHIYKIPKSHIEGYNGDDVFLDLSVARCLSMILIPTLSLLLKKPQLLPQQNQQQKNRH